MLALLDRAVFPGETLLTLLQSQTQRTPSTRILTWLADGDRESSSFSYSQLDQRARAIAAHLQSLRLKRKRAVLLYRPGLEFVEALFGCFYAGFVAVPAYVPGSVREYPRIEGILQDSDCGITMTTSDSLNVVSQVIAQSAPGSLCLATDTIGNELSSNWVDPGTRASDLAYLQYTSGSTSAPKGVMITHANVLANMESIAAQGGFSDSSVSVSWLPHFHDMGLIYGVLQPIFSRFPAFLLSPAAFIHRPLRWLRAISSYHGTHCGGPNFAYDLCVDRIGEEEKPTLDLSSWQVAFNGAEPVRSGTLARFAAHFESCGFRRKAFYPVYGLAEASLKVTSGEPGGGARVCLVHADKLARSEVVLVDSGTGAREIVSCGKPSYGHEVVIADPKTNSSRATGQIGEIWVAGPSVAAGYWRNSDVTKNTFKAFLNSGRGPYLRTGDMGFISNGELFITGRLKDCIIIRGRNHYPQDLEKTVEASHPALRTNGSAAFSVEQDGQERLVIVSELSRKYRGSPDEAVEAVRAEIAQAHDIQAFAVVFIKSGALPRTSSGKVQRHACKRKWQNNELPVVHQNILSDGPGLETEITREVILAQTDSERKRIVAEYVRHQVARTLRSAVSELSNTRSLIVLGADSLAGFDLMQKIERDLQVNVPIGELLNRNICEITDIVLESFGPEQGSEHSIMVLKRAERPAQVPLSASQSQVWFLQHLFPESCAYNEHLVIRLAGPLDIEALRRAVREMVRRHETLRTRFPNNEGRPYQDIQSFDLKQAPLLEVADLTGQGEIDDRLRALVASETQRPFKLEADIPARFTLWRAAEQEHFLLLVAHHIVCDGASLRVVVHEIGTLYEAYAKGEESPLVEPALQYADYALWQREWLQGEVMEEQLEYWRKQLEKMEPLELATDHARPAVMSHRGGVVAMQFSGEVTEKLKELGRREGVTLFMSLLAVLQVVLSKYAGQKDVAVGTPVANRNAETKDLIGFFVNMLVLRTDLTGNPTFREILGEVRRVSLDAYQHQQVPFEKLVQELESQRDLSHSPLFQVTLAFQSSLEENLAFGGLQFHFPEVDAGIAKFDLNLRITESSSFIRGYLEYSQSIFESSTIQKMVDHLSRVAEEMVRNPEQRVGEVSLLGEEEREQVVVEWNRTEREYRQCCMPELFEEQAEKRAEAIGVVDERGEMSYGELNRRANQLGHYLRKKGVGAEVRVGICLERGAGMVVGLLGIMKAGGAYVPLDGGYPEERLKYMVRDAGAAVVVTERKYEERLRGIGAGVGMIVLEEEREEIEGCSEEGMKKEVTEENLAYVIYTSGSTGRPKGVAITHRGLANLVDWHVGRYEVNREDRMTQVASAGFDAAVWEIWPTLAAGASLHVVNDRLRVDAVELVQWLRDQGITIAFLPTPLAETVLKLEGAGESRLRLLLTGGDQLHQIPRQRHDFTLLNHYGPTENTVVTSVEAVPWESEEVPGIGKPIANTQVYVLDEEWQALPVGVGGELYIGGEGLARGYLNRAELTAERFIPNGYSGRGRREAVPDGRPGEMEQGRGTGVSGASG